MGYTCLQAISAGQACDEYSGCISLAVAQWLSLQVLLRRVCSPRSSEVRIPSVYEGCHFFGAIDAAPGRGLAAGCRVHARSQVIQIVGTCVRYRQRLSDKSHQRAPSSQNTQATCLVELAAAVSRHVNAIWARRAHVRPVNQVHLFRPARCLTQELERLERKTHTRGERDTHTRGERERERENLCGQRSEQPHAASYTTHTQLLTQLT